MNLCLELSKFCLGKDLVVRLDAQVQELYKADFLPACYVILGSIFQLHRLMYLRNKKDFERIVNYRIDLEPQAAPPAA